MGLRRIGHCLSEGLRSVDLPSGAWCIILGQASEVIRWQRPVSLFRQGAILLVMETVALLGRGLATIAHCWGGSGRASRVLNSLAILIID